MQRDHRRRALELEEERGRKRGEDTYRTTHIQLPLQIPMQPLRAVYILDRIAVDSALDELVTRHRRRREVFLRSGAEPRRDARAAPESGVVVDRVVEDVVVFFVLEDEHLRERSQPHRALTNCAPLS